MSSLQGVLRRRFTGCLRRHGELIVRAGFRLTIGLEPRLDRDRRSEILAPARSRIVVGSVPTGAVSTSVAALARVDAVDK